MTDIERTTSVITGLISKLSSVEEVLELTSIKGIGPARQTAIIKAIADAGPNWTIADLPNYTGVEYSFDIPSLDSAKKQSHADIVQLVQFVLAADAKRQEATDLQTKKETLIADKKALGVETMQKQIDDLTKVIDDDKADKKAKAEAIAKVKPLHTEIATKRKEAADLQAKIDETQAEQDKLNAQAEFITQPLKKVAKRRMAKAYYLAKNPIEFSKFQASLPNPASKWAEAVWESVKAYPELLEELKTLKAAKLEMVQALKDAEIAQAEALAKAEAKATAKAEYRAARAAAKAEARKAKEEAREAFFKAQLEEKLATKPTFVSILLNQVVPTLEKRYNRMVRSFNAIIKLATSTEGSATTARAEEKLEELEASYRNFLPVVVRYQTMVEEYAKNPSPLLNGQFLVALQAKVEHMASQVTEFYKANQAGMEKLIEVGIEGLLLESFAQASNDQSIFNVLVHPTFDFSKYALEENISDAVSQNIRARVRKCYDLKIDFTSKEVSTGENKLVELKGVDHDLLEQEFDFTFDTEVFEKIEAKFEEIEAEKQIEILKMKVNMETAGKTYIPMPTVEFKNDGSIGLGKAYGARSIIEHNANSLQIKVDTEDEVRGMHWIGRAAAKNLNYALMMSAGGGFSFLNTGGLKVYSAISNSIVDAKAYVASLAGSACIREITAESGLGVKLWLYLDENGDPIMVDGKPKVKINGNEGSHWHQVVNEFARQFRIVPRSLIDFAIEVDKVQRKLNQEFREWELSQRINLRLVFFLMEVISNKEIFKDLKDWKGLPKSRAGMNELRSLLGNIKRVQVVHPDLLKQAILSKSVPQEEGESDDEYSNRITDWLFRLDNAKVNKLSKLLIGNGTTLVLPSTDISIDLAKMALVKGKSYVHAEVKKDKAIGEDCIDFNVDGITQSGKMQLIKVLLGSFAVSVEADQRGAALRAVLGEENEITPIVDYAKKQSDYGWKFHDLHFENKLFAKSSVGAAAIEKMRVMGFGGVNFAQARKEMELAANWPEFQGLESLWGFKFEVSEDVKKQVAFVTKHREDIENFKANKKEILEAWPSLVADKLEEAILDKDYDVKLWLNAHADSFLGKGKSLPVDMEKAFKWFDENDLMGPGLDKEIPSIVINALDGIKNNSYKSPIQKAVMAILEKHFYIVPESSSVEGDRLKSMGLIFGETMLSSIMIMREMKIGTVGLTFQATEKVPTYLFGGAGIAATLESTIKYKKYLGILPCGGEYNRRDLPQIPAKATDDFLDYLNVDWTEEDLAPGSLKPLQKFVTRTDSKSTKRLLVSSDGFILDGHHRWVANKDEELISVIRIDMEASELLEQARSYSGSFFAKPTRWECIEEYFEVMDKKAMVDGNGNVLSGFSIKLDPTSESLPLDLYLKMIEAVCKIEGPYLIEKIRKNLQTSNDGELLQIIKQAGGDLIDSSTLSKAFLDSLNAKLSTYIRGALIKGKNIPVHVMDCLPKNCIVLPPSFKNSTIAEQFEKELCLSWRYPIASATSVGIMEVIYGDDPRVKQLLEDYGIDFENYPLVVLMSSGAKTWFQYDDDGDAFGKLQEPSWEHQSWKDLLAVAMDEIEGFATTNKEGEVAPVKAQKKLWHKVKAWTVLSINLLDRQDYPNQNIEMDDVKTDKNKKSMRIVDIHGFCTKEFQEWSSRDGRGPVGLVSDLFSVILSSGLQGREFTELAAVCGYILQHSIDSAKKEKLVIPPRVLLSRKTYVEIDGMLELHPELNKIILEWNEAWEAMDKAWIKTVEAKAEAIFGADWLPTVEEIVEACKYDVKVLFIAPSTLLSNMSSYAKEGKYGTYNIFGTEVLVHPNLVDAKDSTRYTSAHILNIHDFHDSDGKKLTWAALNDFRKVNIMKLLDFKSVNKPKLNEKGLPVKDRAGKPVWESYITWGNRTDSANFPAYFTEVMETSIQYSVPNSVYKYVSRWALELLFSGKDNLANFSKEFGSQRQYDPDLDVMVDSNKSVLKKDFKLPKLPHIPSRTRGMFTGKNFIKNIGPADSQDVGKMTCSFVNPALRKEAMSVLYRHISMVVSSNTKAKVSVEVLKTILPKWDFGDSKALTMDEIQSLECFDRIQFVKAFMGLGQELGMYEISRDQYKPLTEEEQAFLAANKGNKSVVAEFTKYQIGETLYSYQPSDYVNRITRKINAAYEKEITKNGRYPEATWQIPFYNKNFKTEFAWQQVPSWFVGTKLDWCMTVLNFIVDESAGFLNRLFEDYACELTEEILNEIEESKDTLFYSKSLNSVEMTAKLNIWNIKHVNMTGESIVDCICCSAHIKKKVTAEIRKSKAVRGTTEWEIDTAKNQNSQVAKTLIQSIKAQAKECLTDRSKVEEYGFDQQMIIDYVSAFGDDSLKASFGLATQADILTFEDWDKRWSNLEMIHPKGKSRIVFIHKLEEEFDFGKWWNLPIDYLINQIDAFNFSFRKEKKLTDAEKAAGMEVPVWMSLADWNAKSTITNDDDNDPKPPTGGGSKKPGISVADLVEGEPAAKPKAAAPSGAQPKGLLKYFFYAEPGCNTNSAFEEVKRVGQLIKDSSKTQKVLTKEEAELIVIFAAQDDSALIKNTQNWAVKNKKRVCVLNIPAHLKGLESLA